MRTQIVGLVLCLLFGVSAYAQPPGSAPGPGKGPAPTAFVVKFKIKPGQNAAFEKAFAAMVVGVRKKEPGNITYDLFHEAQDPQTYVVFEHYRNAAAVAAHGKSAHGKKLMAALKDLLDGRPDADRLVFVMSK